MATKFLTNDESAERHVKMTCQTVYLDLDEKRTAVKFLRVIQGKMKPLDFSIHSWNEKDDDDFCWYWVGLKMSRIEKNRLWMRSFLQGILKAAGAARVLGGAGAGGGMDVSRCGAGAQSVIRGGKGGQMPELWDGRAAGRIVKSLGVVGRSDSEQVAGGGVRCRGQL